MDISVAETRAYPALPINLRVYARVRLEAGNKTLSHAAAAGVCIIPHVVTHPSFVFLNYYNYMNTPLHIFSLPAPRVPVGNDASWLFCSLSMLFILRE